MNHLLLSVSLFVNFYEVNSFQRLQYIQICGFYWHSRGPFKWRELTHLLGPVFFRLFPETCLSDQYSARNAVLLALQLYSQKYYWVETLMQSKLPSDLYPQSTSVYSPYFVCSYLWSEKFFCVKIWKKRKALIGYADPGNAALGPEVVLVLRKLQFVSFLFNLTGVRWWLRGSVTAEGCSPGGGQQYWQKAKRAFGFCLSSQTVPWSSSWSFTYITNLLGKELVLTRLGWVIRSLAQVVPRELCPRLRISFLRSGLWGSKGKPSVEPDVQHMSSAPRPRCQRPWQVTPWSRWSPGQGNHHWTPAACDRRLQYCDQADSSPNFQWRGKKKYLKVILFAFFIASAEFALDLGIFSRWWLCHPCHLDLKII